jgi:hypothetical protein
MPAKKSDEYDGLDLSVEVAKAAQQIREVGFVDDDGQPVSDHDGNFRGPWDAKTEQRRRLPAYRDKSPELPTMAAHELIDYCKASLLGAEPSETWKAVKKRRKSKRPMEA